MAKLHRDSVAALDLDSVCQCYLQEKADGKIKRYFAVSFKDSGKGYFKWFCPAFPQMSKRKWAQLLADDLVQHMTSSGTLGNSLSLLCLFVKLGKW